MVLNSEIDRRVFLTGAGAFLLSGASSPALEKLEKSETVFASAYMKDDGSYGVMLLDEFGHQLSDIALPSRGHDIAFDRISRRGVAFARRPGNIAIVFSVDNEVEPKTIVAPGGRHFYGHGVFSRDGRLLYATENDFEKARGVVGIYDTANEFQRIAEFSSFGIGPHEILIHPHQNILIVANGGIETHPDYGRVKLNIPTMEPSLAFIDAQTGYLIEQHFLPKRMHKLSIRHMEVSSQGKVYFGCQYEGSKSDSVSLVGSTQLEQEIQLFDIGQKGQNEMGHYVGSVALSSDEEMLAITLPKSNRIALFDTKQRKLVSTAITRQAFGVAKSKNGFSISSTDGLFGPIEQQKQFNEIAFDNHISTF